MTDSRYLSEAFQALRLLDEDTFDISNDGLAELNNFTSKSETEEVEQIIDPLATSEEELQDSYVGKVILDCSICQSKIYKDPSDIVISEDGALANVGDICPYCQSSDGYKIVGQVAEYCANCEQEPQGEDEVDINVEEKPEEENLEEDLQKIELETDTQKIEIEAKPKDEETHSEEEEVIAPVSDETEAQFKDESEVYDDVEFDEFDEEGFNSLGEKYLKRVYENVASFKVISGKTCKDKLMIEGLISFKSGKKAKTNFVFEAFKSSNGKLIFLGENAKFSNKKGAFKLVGSAENNKLMVESLNYNYSAKGEQSKSSRRFYGTVKK